MNCKHVSAMTIATIRNSRPDLQNAARSAKDVLVSSLKKCEKGIWAINIAWTAKHIPLCAALYWLGNVPASTSTSLRLQPTCSPPVCYFTGYCSIFPFFLPFSEFPLPPPPYSCLALPVPLALHKSYLEELFSRNSEATILAQYLQVWGTRQRHLNLSCIRLSPTVVILILWAVARKGNTFRNL